MSDEFHVFFSYNSKDKPRVLELAEAVEGRSLHVWLDAWELEHGGKWLYALEEIIGTVKTAAVLIGEGGVGQWQREEMAAVVRESVKRTLRVIPVLLPGTSAQPEDLPVFLQNFTCVDLRNGLTDDNLNWLCRNIRPREDLPPRPQPFFGRKAELEDLVDTLLQDSPKPTPIVGDPGMGKSTFALVALHDPKVAQKYRVDREDRRFFIRCQSSTDSREKLVALIADDLGVAPGRARSSPQVSALEIHICNELAKAPAVLVLDNAETLLWVDNPIPVQEWLARLAEIPRLALVVTMRGRRPPRISWRRTIDLGPLDRLNARQAFLSEAGTQQFENDPRVDILVDKVDRVPLAVVLIASAAQDYGDLGTVLALWEQRRLELGRSGPGTSVRETNLDASLDLSIESPGMTDAGRRLLKLLALLPNGLQHPGQIEAILPGWGLQAALLLPRRSLAFLEGGRLRVRAPVRDSVERREQKFPTQKEDLDRLIQHFVQLALTCSPLHGTAQGAKAVEQLTAEAGNLEAMLLLGLEQHDSMSAIDATLKVANVILYAGQGTPRVPERARDVARQRGEHLYSGQGTPHLLEHARDVARQRGNHLAHAHCNKLLGDFAHMRSDYGTAQKYYQEALEFYTAQNDALFMAHCINSLGRIEVLYGSKYDTAVAHFEHARALYHNTGNLQGEAAASKGLGDVHREQGDYDKARQDYEKALALYNQEEDLWGQAGCLQGLADCDLARNDDERAHEKYDRAFDRYQSMGGDMLGQGNCRKAQGDIALKHGRWEEAARYYEEANLYHEPLQNAVCLANLAKGFGDIARGKQQYSDAISHYRRALKLYGETKNVMGEAYCMKSLADTHLAALEYPEAKRVYERARRLFAQLDTPAWQIQEAACIKGLGDVARGQGDYSQAQKRYLEALPHFKKHNDGVGEAYCLKSLGEAELRLAVPAYELAVERFTRAAQLFQQSHKRHSAAACLLSAGQAAMANATHHIQQALQLFDQLGDQERRREMQQLLDAIKAAGGD